MRSALPIGLLAASLLLLAVYHRPGSGSGPIVEDVGLQRGVGSNVTVLCFVMTALEKETLERTRAAHTTWGRRCDRFVVTASEAVPGIETLIVPRDPHESSQRLYRKLGDSLEAIHNTYGDRYDYIVKADDDSFVVLHHLRDYLSKFNASEPVYAGKRYKLNGDEKQQFNAGGCYVLSRESLRRVVEARQSGVCETAQNGPEDKMLGDCMRKLAIPPEDTRDMAGRERFLVFDIRYMFTFTANKEWWYDKYSYNTVFRDATCCSPQLISMHYVKTADFALYDYLFYQID